MFWAHHAPGLFLGVIGNVIWLLLLALLIGTLIRLLIGRKRTWGPYPPAGPFNPPPPGPPRWKYQPQQQLSALEILQQRYARGEIDAATFDQMRERLEASSRPPQQ
jgi:putative membrane protein